MPIHQISTSSLSNISSRIAIPPLAANEVHIWAISVSKFIASNMATELFLSPDELLRQGEFRLLHLRQRYHVARGMLRSLLARYTAIPPADIQFSANEFGKPRCANLCPAAQQIEFNLSHSHDLILYAFSLNRAVGVDIEFIKPKFSYTKIAARFFSPREIQDLSAVSPNLQRQAFFNCWVRKEALLKAWGIGLSYSLDKFSVDVAERLDQELVSFQVLANSEEFAVSPNWQLNALAIDPAYTSAVAVAASALLPQVKIRKFLHN